MPKRTGKKKTKAELQAMANATTDQDGGVSTPPPQNETTSKLAEEIEAVRFAAELGEKPASAITPAAGGIAPDNDAPAAEGAPTELAGQIFRAVTSSNLAAIRYQNAEGRDIFENENAKTGALLVKFKNGAIWEYGNVPRGTFQELMKADSIGAFFNSEIVKNKEYPARKIADKAPAATETPSI